MILLREQGAHGMYAASLFGEFSKLCLVMRPALRVIAQTAPATLTDAKQAHNEPVLFSELFYLPKFGVATHNAARFTCQQQLIVDPVHEKNLS